jgi:diaminopimelate epimerase
MRVTHWHADGKAAAVEADLGAPRLAPRDVPCRLPAGPEGDLREAKLPYERGFRTATILSMGNPHCVVFVDEAPSDELVATIGPQLEYHPAFPERTNVEFVEVLTRNRLRQRTWERGAGETLACGSGACAVVVAAALTGRSDRSATIELRGGELGLVWRESDDHVVMTGPAVEAFRGEWG